MGTGRVHAKISLQPCHHVIMLLDCSGDPEPSNVITV